MSILARFGNLWKGFWSRIIEGAETDNPEAVYQAAIEARLTQYQKLMKAVSGIVYLRNKLEKDLESKSAELADVAAQIPVAVQANEEQAALALIERKNVLSRELETTKIDLEKVSAQAEEAKKSLVAYQSEIEKLKAERETMLAKREHAKARLQIQEQLSGLSASADIQALDAVRESIHKLEAQADVAREVHGTGLAGKLEQIKAQTGSAAARAEFEEIKRQLGQQASREGGKTL